MDGIEDTEDIFTEDAGITATAVDSLNGSVNKIHSCIRKITCIYAALPIEYSGSIIHLE